VTVWEDEVREVTVWEDEVREVTVWEDEVREPDERHRSLRLGA
jgi:hypothetical protein